MAWIKWENTWNRKLLTNEHNILLYSSQQEIEVVVWSHSKAQPKTELYIHSILIIQNYKILSLSLSFSLSPSLPLWKTLKVIILSRLKRLISFLKECQFHLSVLEEKLMSEEPMVTGKTIKQAKIQYSPHLQSWCWAQEPDCLGHSRRWDSSGIFDPHPALWNNT